MLTKKLIMLLAVLMFAPVAFGAILQANVVDNNATESLSITEVNAQGGLWVGDKLFSDFRVTSKGTGIYPKASEISVTGVEVQGPNGIEYGLRFNGFWQTWNGNTVDTLIKFKVSISENAPSLLIHDNSLWMSAVVAERTGIVAITENVYANDPDVFPNSVSLADKYVYKMSTEQLLYDHEEFAPLRTIWVVKDIGLAGGGRLGHAVLSEFGQSFSQIPEPATLALLTTGAALLAARRRR